MSTNSTTAASLTDHLAKQFIVDDQEEVEEQGELNSPIPDSICEPFGGIAHDFREDTIFVLDIGADNKQPGTLRGEQCPLQDITNNSYDYLYSQYPHWRRLLSDEYMRNMKFDGEDDRSPSSEGITTPLVLLHLDDHAWASVVHYLTASKLILQQPDIYSKLFLDSGHSLSQQSASYIKALSQRIQLSEDARRDWVDNRKVAAWRRALLAKFAQNEDLQRALILTGWAKLVDKYGKPHYLLMWVRTVLRGEYQQQIQQQQQTMIKDMAMKIKEDKNIEDILRVFEELFGKDKQQILTTILSALSNSSSSSSSSHNNGENKAPITTSNHKQQVTIQAKPIEMKDAVGYLEQIKNEESPQTYHHFLEIMTEFKSEKINTPQVLERVTLLFKGKPWLIRKFLMFLPPSHILDLSPENNLNLIYITSPTGNKIIIDTDKGVVNYKKE